MIVSIHQPAYLPWPGYFARIAASDLHIVLDHVQFEKNSFINRNKIRTADGWTWLTVPVKTKGRFKRLPVNEVKINNVVPWKKKHWRSLQLNYSKSPFFNDHAGFFEEIYHREWILLLDLCTMINGYLAEVLHISTHMKSSSAMSPEGNKAELVLNLCQSSEADVYLSGPLGKRYLDEEKFDDAGVEVRYCQPKFSDYPQVFSGPFEASMSVLDMIFNVGKMEMCELCASDNLAGKPEAESHK